MRCIDKLFIDDIFCFVWLFWGFLKQKNPYKLFIELNT